MLKGKILLSAGGGKHDKNQSLKYSYFSYTSFKLGGKILSFIKERHFRGGANPFSILTILTLNYALIL